MKKESVLKLSLIQILFMINIVQAQNNIINSFDFNLAQGWIIRFINALLGFLSPVFELIIGDYNTSEFFFAKILLFILLVIIIKNILDRTPIGENNEKISFVLSLVVSTLSIRFISQNQFFEAIFIQYGTIGIAITTILPMVIFFYFIQNTKVGTYGRKVFWTIYVVTLSAIWISKSNEIPTTANWIYGITITTAIIFIFFDKSINAYFGLTEINRMMNRTNKKLIRKLLKELDDLKNHYHHGRIPRHEYRAEVKEIIRQIKELQRED